MNKQGVNRMIGFDRYDNLKEQCSICKDIGRATEEDCLGCPKRAAIRQYEDRMQEPSSINVPVFSEESDGFGEYQIIGYRKEYV